jgi:hypothetical protein
VARPRRKHVLRTPLLGRPRAVRLGIAATTALALATPAGAVVWFDEGPASSGPRAQGEPDRTGASTGSGVTTWPEQLPEVTEAVVPAARLTARAKPSEKARDRKDDPRSGQAQAAEAPDTAVDNRARRRPATPETGRPQHAAPVKAKSAKEAKKAQRGPGAGQAAEPTSAPAEVPSEVAPQPEPATETERPTEPTPDPTPLPTQEPAPIPDAPADSEPEPEPNLEPDPEPDPELDLEHTEPEW